MAEVNRFLSWDPTCSEIQTCCDTRFEDDVLSAGPNDVWYLPLGTSSSFDLYSADGTLIQAGFGTQSPTINSSFSFQVSGLCEDVEPTDCNENPCQDDCGCEGASYFRFAAKYRDKTDDCTPTDICGTAIEYTGNESDFLDDIVTELSSYFDVVTRDSNIITVEWLQTLDISDDWRCRAILTTRTDFSSVESECNPWIEGDCLIPEVAQNLRSNRCTTYKFLEQMQLQGANVCIKIINKKTCVDGEPLTQFRWATVPTCGLYYILSDYGCSQLINLCDVCDTTFVKWRNNNQQWKQMRLKAVIRNVEFTKKEEVVYQPNGSMNKIYSESEVSWELAIGQYRAFVHKDIQWLLENDIVIFNDFFEVSWIRSDRQFICKEPYTIEWSSEFPTIKTSLAKTRITQVNADINNSYD